MFHPPVTVSGIVQIKSPFSSPLEMTTTYLDRALQYYLSGRFSQQNNMLEPAAINFFWMMECLLHALDPLKIEELRSSPNNIVNKHKLCNLYKELNPEVTKIFSKKINKIIARIQTYYELRYPSQVKDSYQIIYTDKKPSFEAKVPIGTTYFPILIDDIDWLFNYFLQEFFSSTHPTKNYLQSRLMRYGKDTYIEENKYALISENNIPMSPKF